MRELRVLALVLLVACIAAITSRGCSALSPTQVPAPADAALAGVTPPAPAGTARLATRSDDLAANPRTLSPEAQEVFDKGVAVFARHYNTILPTIARNELPFTCEIIEIRKPTWGYFDEKSVVATTEIIYRTEDGSVLVAQAYFSDGKWTVRTGDDFNLGATPNESANGLRVLFEAKMNRTIEVSE